MINGKRRGGEGLGEHHGHHSFLSGLSTRNICSIRKYPRDCHRRIVYPSFHHLLICTERLGSHALLVVRAVLVVQIGHATLSLFSLFILVYLQEGIMIDLDTPLPQMKCLSSYSALSAAASSHKFWNNAVLK